MGWSVKVRLRRRIWRKDVRLEDWVVAVGGLMLRQGDGLALDWAAGGWGMCTLQLRERLNIDELRRWSIGLGEDTC